jgi:hypothetical protein
LAKTFDGIGQTLFEWLTDQPVFFVATAALDPEGSVN